MSIHERIREAQSREAASLMDANERSPREFASSLEGFEFAFMPLAEQRKLRAYEHDRKALEARIAEDTQAVTSAWAIWTTFRRNDVALNENERNLGRMWDRIVTKAVEDQAEAAVEEFGADYLRRAGAL